LWKVFYFCSTVIITPSSFHPFHSRLVSSGSWVRSYGSLNSPSSSLWIITVLCVFIVREKPYNIRVSRADREKTFFFYIILSRAMVLPLENGFFWLNFHTFKIWKWLFIRVWWFWGGKNRLKIGVVIAITRFREHKFFEKWSSFKSTLRAFKGHSWRGSKTLVNKGSYVIARNEVTKQSQDFVFPAPTFVSVNCSRNPDISLH